MQASVVSPFTSRSKSVASCVDLLREGRAALHTSFAAVRFLLMWAPPDDLSCGTLSWLLQCPALTTGAHC